MERFLGDVIVSDSVVYYDFGRQYPGGFGEKTGVNDTLVRPSQAICLILASLQARRSRTYAPYSVLCSQSALDVLRVGDRG